MPKTKPALAPVRCWALRWKETGEIHRVTLIEPIQKWYDKHYPGQYHIVPGTFTPDAVKPKRKEVRDAKA